MPRTGRQPAVGLAPRPCASCGKVFQPYRSHQIACSRPCRDRTKDQSPRRTEYDLTCQGCGIQFQAQWTGMGRQPSCVNCTAALRLANQGRKNVARRVSTNPDRREVNLRQGVQRYGITFEQYEVMLTKQDGRCAICGDRPDPDGRGSSARLHVDHHHGTKQVRGLLCGRCNVAIGMFREDSRLLRSAVDYLTRTTEAGELVPPEFLRSQPLDTLISSIVNAYPAEVRHQMKE